MFLRSNRSTSNHCSFSKKMSQPTILYYGSEKPQNPIRLSQHQQWGDFSTEARTIRRAQDRARLEQHFEHRGNSSVSKPAPLSSYRDRGLSQSERHRISQIKSATRAALGPSFNFIDEASYCLLDHTDEYQRSRGWTDQINGAAQGVIPQDYIYEFNRYWHEDDEDNDADQYIADYQKEAPWRKHAPSAYAVSTYSVSSRSRTSTTPLKVPKRADSGYESMVSFPQTPSPGRPGSSNRSRKGEREENYYRAKQAQRPQACHHLEQAKRSRTSCPAEQSRVAQGAERPKTPVPGLVSNFSWDEEVEASKKRRGGFFGLLHRH